MPHLLHLNTIHIFTRWKEIYAFIGIRKFWNSYHALLVPINHREIIALFWLWLVPNRRCQLWLYEQLPWQLQECALRCCWQILIWNMWSVLLLFCKLGRQHLDLIKEGTNYKMKMISIELCESLLCNKVYESSQAILLANDWQTIRIIIRDVKTFLIKGDENVVIP